jgi:hypothetical protein
MTLVSTKPLIETSTSSISGVKRLVRNSDNPTVTLCRCQKPGSLNFLETSGSVQAFNGTALALPLLTVIFKTQFVV